MKGGPFDLIIFDYDGVIADSELLNNAVMAELLSEIGLPTTVDDALATYLGKRWLDCEAIISERLGAPCPPGVRDEWTRRCHDRARRDLRSVAGFDGFLPGAANDAASPRPARPTGSSWVCAVSAPMRPSPDRSSAPLSTSAGASRIPTCSCMRRTP